MNKFFGHAHFWAALLVLAYFCIGPVMGAAGTEYWSFFSWLMLVTSVLATYFCWQQMGSGAASSGAFYFTAATMGLVVHQTLAGSLNGDFSELGMFTVLLYVVTGVGVGKKLKSA